MKSYKCNLIIGAVFLLLAAAGCSAEDRGSGLPEGCIVDSIKFSGKDVILNYGTADAQSLYLLHNVSGETLLLNQKPKKDPGASAGWASEVGSGNWSALAISVSNFDFTCANTAPGSYEELTCKDVLKVCRFSNPVFNSGNSGSYWVSENKPLGATMDGIKTRGIGL